MVMKEKKGRAKIRTFERLVADLPVVADIQIVPNSKRNAVHVKRGGKRIFGYNGAVLVVNRKEYLDGLTYEVRNYGFILPPTMDNMLAIMRKA